MKKSLSPIWSIVGIVVLVLLALLSWFIWGSEGLNRVRSQAIDTSSSTSVEDTTAKRISELEAAIQAEKHDPEKVLEMRRELQKLQGE